MNKEGINNFLIGKLATNYLNTLKATLQISITQILNTTSTI